MKINKDSLQARIHKISQEKGISPNIVLQNYFFDSVLKRLAKSKYSNKFIFKGGFLLSIVLGINYRSTLDMDFLLKNISLTKDSVENVIQQIIDIKIDDNIVFQIKGISEIRQNDEYGGYNVTLIGHLDNIKANVNIDLATGDPITPNSIHYSYRCLLDNELLKLSTYNFETIVAEKLQTVLMRGTANSRSKDFYDLYIIHKLKWEEIDKKNLTEAFINTCNYRETPFSKEEAFKILNQIKNSQVMISRWEQYKKKNEFAKDINFDIVIEAILTIVNEL